MKRLVCMFGCLLVIHYSLRIVVILRCLYVYMYTPSLCDIGVSAVLLFFSVFCFFFAFFFCCSLPSVKLAVFALATRRTLHMYSYAHKYVRIYVHVYVLMSIIITLFRFIFLVFIIISVLLFLRLLLPSPFIV